MSVVSLFSGCGGLDFGFEAAGWEILFRNDFDRHSCDTLALNADGEVVQGAIEDISTEQIRSVVGRGKNAVDLVIGGPPCQPFSKSAYWSRGDTLRLRDPRANTLDEYFRVVEDLTPRAFLLENVHGISYSGKEEGFQFLIERIRDINRKKGTDYRPSWRVVNAADYGVPQLRVRFFLVALRDGNEFRFPQPTHTDADNGNATLFDIHRAPYSTAWDALRHIQPDSSEKLTVGGKWGSLLPSIPEGENYLWHTDRKDGLPLFGWRTRYWCFLLKLAKSRPSWTIQAQPGSAVGPFHWENRKLSWREIAAIQTFPKGFKIKCPRVEIQRQLGNAVPSLLAETLARALKEQIYSERFDDPRKLAVPKARFIPEPEEPEKVPKEYLYLVGEHTAHPGTGKGRSYQTGHNKRMPKTPPKDQSQIENLNLKY
ncbi:MAG: DNA cytosine methyltransferase [Verrucomicrobiota bacterium]